MSILALKVEVVIPELSQRGYSLFVETTPDDNYWTIACSNCAVVTVPQKKILIARSYTEGRGMTANEMKEVFKKAGLGTE